MSTSTEKAATKLESWDSERVLRDAIKARRSRASTTPGEPVQQPKSRFRLLPWVLAALFLVTTLISWLRQPRPAPSNPPPWPLAALFDPPNRPIEVVVADVNYGMTRLIDERPQ